MQHRKCLGLWVRQGFSNTLCAFTLMYERTTVEFENSTVIAATLEKNNPSTISSRLVTSAKRYEAAQLE
jgi:hypothetical protein